MAPVRRDIAAINIDGVMNMRSYAIVIHVVCLVLAGTLIALFQAAPRPSALGVSAWVMNGAGYAIAAAAVGLLGLLYKRDRLAGFMCASLVGVVLMIAGSA